MKKQVFLRGAMGLPLGISIGYVITILISLGWGDGTYYPCVPELAEQVGSQTGAVVLQAVLCGVLGASFGSASVIWEIERWSIAKQTGIYFLVVSVTMLPVAYFTHWMEHSLIGILSYFSIFLMIFIVIWITQYCFWRRRIKALNAEIGKKE